MSLLTREEHKAPEFTDEQLYRLDIVEDAARKFLNVLAETDDQVWDLDDVWDLIYEGSDRLTKRGRRVRVPTHVTTKEGTEYITDWYGEEEIFDAGVEH